MITTVTAVQRFATKTLYTRARATDGSTMLAPMSPRGGQGLNYLRPVKLVKSVHRPERDLRASAGLWL